MKKTLVLAALSLVLALPASPQASALTLYQTAAPPVQSVSASYQGTAAGTPIYYWVIARYPGGYSVPVGPAAAYNTVGANNLSAANRVFVSWTLMPSATGYDVLHSQAPMFPANPGCTDCAVVKNTALNSVTDDNTVNLFWPDPGMAGSQAIAAVITIDNLTRAYPYYQSNINGAMAALALIYGVPVANNCAQFDALGRIVDSGAGCVPVIPPTAWGTITGVLANQLDLAKVLAAKQADMGITGKVGNTNNFQAAGAGAPALNDCAKYDANGNIVTSGAPCAAGGVSAEVIVPFNAGSPTFDFSLGVNFKITLTGDATVVTFTPVNGKVVTIKVVQDATGGRKIYWPANSKSFAAIAATAGTMTVYQAAMDAANVYATGGPWRVDPNNPPDLNVAPWNTAAWKGWNPGPATVTNYTGGWRYPPGNGGLVFYNPGDGESCHMFGFTEASIGTPYTAIMGFTIDFFDASDIDFAGITRIDNAGRAVMYAYAYWGGWKVGAWGIHTNTSYDGYLGGIDPIYPSWGAYWTKATYLKITNDGTNVLAYYSQDRVTWTLFYTGLATANGMGPPYWVGIGMRNKQAAAKPIIMHVFYWSFTSGI
jgi:hypothetical protein